jgi:gamma-glutamylcyclotransferase (GGCT)/AIG2-like uncharacterized protein YtfP
MGDQVINGASTQYKVPPTCKSLASWDTWAYFFQKWVKTNLKKPADANDATAVEAYNDAYELAIVQAMPVAAPFHDKVQGSVFRLSKSGKHGPFLLAALDKLYSTKGTDLDRAKALTALESFRRGSLTLHESMQQLDILQQEAALAGCDIGFDYSFFHIRSACGADDLRDAMRALTGEEEGHARNKALVKELERIGKQQKATDALIDSVSGGRQKSSATNPQYSGAAQHQQSNQSRRGSKTHQHGLIDGSDRKASTSSGNRVQPTEPCRCKFCGTTHVPGIPNCPVAINNEKCERCYKVGRHKTHLCPVEASKLPHLHQYPPRKPGGNWQDRRQSAAHGAVGDYPGNDGQYEQDF